MGLAQALYFQLFPDRVPELAADELPGASKPPPGGGVPTAEEAAQAVAVGSALEQSLQSGRLVCCPPVPFLLDARLHPAGAGTPVVVFDLADRGDAELMEAARQCGSGEVAPMTQLFQRRLDHEAAALGLGKYNEDRLVYQSEHFTGNPAAARTLHLGIDLFCPAGTPVFAVCSGVVHSVANNTRVQDYGPTVIVEHALPEPVGGAGSGGEAGGEAPSPWYSLYGHLQVMTHRGLGGWRGDYPGVCRAADAELYLAVCRDPNWLLGCRELGHKG